VASRRHWAALAALTLARVAMGVQFQSVGALSPLLMDRLGIANTELGILIGLFALPGIVLALPGGMLGQRLGDRRVVVGALLLMTLGSSLLGEASAFAVAAAGRFLTAVGAVLLNVLGTKLVADWFTERELTWAMAIFLNAWPFGTGLALVTLPTIASLWAVAAAFHVAAAMAAIGAAAVATVVPHLPAREVEQATASPARLSRREVRLVTLAAVPWILYNVGYAVMLGFAPAFLVRGGFSVEQAGALLGLALALLVVSVQAGGAAAQWIARPEGVATLSLLAHAVLLSLLPYTPALPSLTAIGLVAGLPAAVLGAAPARVLRAETRSTGMGLFYTWYYAGMAVLPSAAGWFQDALGGPAAIEFAAGAILATWVSYLVFRTARSRAENA
jgi:predicted MFS family arabinose efflux permease